MQRTITYTVIIGRHQGKYVATCPALRDVVCVATNRREAYRAIKRALRTTLTALMLTNKSLPTDPIVSVKHLRLDLLDLKMEGELR